MGNVQEMQRPKTHYRKAFDSPYLSSADIVEPTTLTIARVALEPDKSKKSKDNFNTAYFVEKEIRPGEKLKPMILNATNSRVLKDMCGSPWIDDWQGTVTVYVDRNVKFGRDTVEGLRIKKGEAPAVVTEEQVITLQGYIDQLDDKAGFFTWLRGNPHRCANIAKLPKASYGDIRKMLATKVEKQS